MADALVIEDPIIRAGAVATALVAVGVVLRWVHLKIKHWYGVDRVGAVERKVDELRDEVADLRSASDVRLASIEGQVATILALLVGGNATAHRNGE